MAVLYIRNSSGEFEEVRSLNGKTAYQAAKEGGYTGTESEFNTKLAQPEYSLPIATESTLGGVKPVTKSSNMTRAVGVDESGGLWTQPIELDATLTKAGQAADAAKTGEAIGKLKDDLVDAIISNARKASADFGKNLFNKNSTDNLQSRYYNSQGNALENNTYGISHYISVASGETYSLKNCGTAQTFSVIFNRSLEKVLITSDKIITIPSDGVLMKVTYTVKYLDSVQVEIGESSTSFSEFTDRATANEAKATANEAKATANEAKATANEAKAIITGGISAKNTDFFVKVLGKNLFNPNDPDAGYYLMNQTTGAITSNDLRFTTGFIHLKKGESAVFSVQVTSSAGIEERRLRTCYSMAGYNSNKELIPETLSSNVSSYTAENEEISFIRVCFYTNFNNLMIEYGTSIDMSVDAYEPYKEEYRLKEVHREQSVDKLISKVEKNTSDIAKLQGTDVKAYLPDIVYCAVGRTIEIYNQYVCLNDEKYHINWVCSIGKALKRKFSITGTESLIGDHDLTLNICDDDLNVVWTKTATLKIVSNVITDTWNINTIGDSLSNNKLWLGECERLSAGKVQYVGTNAFSQSIEGGNYTGGHEGYPGVAGNFFLTETNGFYTNPYYTDADNVFDVEGYISRNKLSINAIQIMLGTNGIAGYDARISEIKSMIEHIRAWNMTIPIFVVAPIYRGNQNGIGVQTNNEGYAVQAGRYEYEYRTYSFKMIENEEKMVKELNDSNIHFIPLGLYHDGEYNFGTVPTAVNPRCDVTENMPTESVHPQPCGQLQMADELFSTYCGILG